MSTDNYANEDATQELLRISKWPEPLRLAYLLEKEMQWPLHGRAADELRKMHAELESIKQAITDPENQPSQYGTVAMEYMQREIASLGIQEQPAQQEPLTNEEIWKFWWSRPEVPEGEDDSMEAEFVAAVRAVLAAHGIKENA